MLLPTCCIALSPSSERSGSWARGLCVGKLEVPLVSSNCRLFCMCQRARTRLQWGWMPSCAPCRKRFVTLFPRYFVATILRKILQERPRTLFCSLKQSDDASVSNTTAVVDVHHTDSSGASETPPTKLDHNHLSLGLLSVVMFVISCVACKN